MSRWAALRSRLADIWHALGYHPWAYPDGESGCRRHCTRPGCNVREVYDHSTDAGWGGLWVDDNESAEIGAQKGME